MDNVASVGDDLNDYSMLVASKRSYVPADASVFVQRIATEVLSSKGGDAAVREAIEKLIVLENLEEKYLALWQ